MDDLKNKGISPDDDNKKIEDVEEIAALLQKELDRAKRERENDGLPDAVTDWDNLVDASVGIGKIKNRAKKEAAAEDERNDASRTAEGEENEESPDGYEREDADEKEDERPPANYGSLSVISLLLVIGLALFSLMSVDSADISTIKSAFKAESYMRQDKIFSALDIFYDICSGENPSEFAIRNFLDICYANGYISDISQAEIITPLDLKRPWNFKYKKMFSSNSKLLATAQAIDEIVKPIAQDSAAEFDYEEVIARLCEYETDKYDQGIVNYYKYYVASLAGKDFQTQLDFLLQAQKGNKDAKWLYISDMALCYRALGDMDKALALVDGMIEENSEETEYTVVKIMLYRMNKQYDEATAICDKAINESGGQGSESSSNYEFHRQLAIINLLKGDYAAALEKAKAAKEISENTATYNILAICYLANGDTAGYDEVTSTLESYSASVSGDVEKYKEGSKTLEEIFLEGRGECV